MNQYKKITKCRCCKSSNIQYLFSLGDQWLFDFPLPENGKKGIVCPLSLVMCAGCKFVQLEHSIYKGDIWGRDTYWYKSGINNAMRLALKDVVEKALALADHSEGDVAIDIGSNDGTLAAFYPDTIRRVGFEPSRNVWLESLGKTKWLKSYNDYFAYKGHTAKIITSCAMFYDLEDPDIFLEDVKLSLAPDGIWVDQQNYLCAMIENKAFDNISHEHQGYYSFSVFEKLLKKHDLEIFDVEVNGLNGGSFRSYIRHKGAKGIVFDGAEDRIADIEKREKKACLTDAKTYLDFYAYAQSISCELAKLIRQIKSEGKSVYVYGASTRGQVVLQFCGLDHTLIDGCAERNPDKYGKVTIGTEIPIYDEEYVRAQNPDYMLVLPYSFINEFVEREANFLKAGGKFIVPLPKVQIIDAAGVCQDE